jgi:hypothetical protein
MHSKASKWDCEEILDTKKLQLFALDEFMYALKYQRINWANGHVTYESGNRKNRGRAVISFKKAVDLYNNNSIKCVFGKPPANLSLWSFDDYTVAKAKAARPLKSIKLQFCKKTHQIIVQDHRVHFTLESYSKLFLNNKYLG